MTPETILALCLHDLETGQKSLGDCVAQYPAYPELEAELRLALALRQMPLPTVSAKTAQHHRAQLRAVAIPRSVPHRWFGWLWQPLPLRRVVAVSLLIFLLMSGPRAALVAAASWPGETLYPVKRADESLQLLVTPEAEQAYIHLLLAERRADELVAQARRPHFTPSLLAEFSQQLDLALYSIKHLPLNARPRALNAVIRLAKRQTMVFTPLIIKTTSASDLEGARQTAERQIQAAQTQLRDVYAELMRQTASP